MYQCPECLLKLQKQQAEDKTYWGCTNCAGHMVGFSALKKFIGDTTTRALWLQSGVTKAEGRPCPSCGLSLRAIMHGADFPIEVDVCRTCHIIWLDQGEIVDFKKIKESRKKVEKTPEQMREYASSLAALAKQSTSRETETDFISNVGPEESWKWMPAIAGLPVEMDRPALRQLPLMTWLVALMCIAIFNFTQHSATAFENFGFVPGDPWRLSSLTWFTSFFMHAGIFHLIGNLYFLTVFGDDVEDDIGALGFISLLFVSHFSGLALQWLFLGPSSVPLVGASAGVFGILAYYMVRFPNTKVGALYLLFFRPYWFRFSARTLFAFKILWELVMIWLFQKNNGGTNIAHVAHIGGAFAGIFAALLMNRRNSQFETAAPIRLTR